MFRTIPATVEPAPVEVPPADLIPLSVLGLDVAEPITGWEPFLTVRNIVVVSDDVGRKAVSRDDARTLIAEHRAQCEAAEARRREVAARNEERAVAADQALRAALPKGLPWWEFPDGVSPVQAWAQAEKDAQPKRTSLLEEALSNSGTLTYHPLPSTPEDES
jgi:hypothetical protein